AIGCKLNPRPTRRAVEVSSSEATGRPRTTRAITKPAKTRQYLSSLLKAKAGPLPSLPSARRTRKPPSFPTRTAARSTDAAASPFSQVSDCNAPLCCSVSYVFCSIADRYKGSCRRSCRGAAGTCGTAAPRGDDFAQLASEKKNLADEVHPEQNSQQCANGAVGVWIFLKEETVQRQNLTSGDDGQRTQ